MGAAASVPEGDYHALLEQIARIDSVFLGGVPSGFHADHVPYLGLAAVLIGVFCSRRAFEGRVVGWLLLLTGVTLALGPRLADGSGFVNMGSASVALPAALPVAVLDACEPLAGAALRIKWPNDVYAGERKLSGVLVDRDSARPEVYRIGVGINVNRAHFPPDLDGKATSLRLLAGHEVDRSAVLLALADSVDAMLTAVSEGGDHRPHLDRFRERLGLLHREVTVTAGSSGTMTGGLQGRSSTGTDWQVDTMSWSYP